MWIALLCLPVVLRALRLWQAYHDKGDHMDTRQPAPVLVCIGKGRYGRRAQAEDMARAYRKQGIWKRIYQCPACKGYHLSSKETRRWKS